MINIIGNLAEEHIDWKWLEGRLNRLSKLKWKFYDSEKKNRLDSLFPSKLLKLKAAYLAIKDLRNKKIDILVSHMPTTTAWAAFFTRKNDEFYHWAYTFNFTNLPNGKKKKMMTKVFEKVNRFTVYSNFERELYSNYFGIPIEKIDFVHWGIEPPVYNKESSSIISGDYICAVGGEARDYETLIETAKLMPEKQFVFVVRPKNIKDLEIPKNVKAMVNIPLEDVYNIIYNSKFCIVPLLSKETPCGNVTIILGMFFEKAQIVTNSKGVSDYAVQDKTALLVEPKNIEDMKEKINKLWNNKTLCDELGKNGYELANNKCTEKNIINYVNGVIDEVGKLK